jgi:hypothetical protein
MCPLHSSINQTIAVNFLELIIYKINCNILHVKEDLIIRTPLKDSKGNFIKNSISSDEVRDRGVVHRRIENFSYKMLNT